MSVAFHGIESLVVTFQTEGVTAGYPAGMSANDTVANAADATAPVGVVLNQRGKLAAVQVKGFARVAYSGTAPSLGYGSLVADGQGGLRTAASGETGRTCLVVQVDTTKNEVGVFL